MLPRSPLVVHREQRPVLLVEGAVVERVRKASLGQPRPIVATALGAPTELPVFSLVLALGNVAVAHLRPTQHLNLPRLPRRPGGGHSGHRSANTGTGICVGGGDAEFDGAER